MVEIPQWAHDLAAAQRELEDASAAYDSAQKRLHDASMKIEMVANSRREWLDLLVSAAKACRASP